MIRVLMNDPLARRLCLAALLLMAMTAEVFAGEPVASDCVCAAPRALAVSRGDTVALPIVARPLTRVLMSYAPKSLGQPTLVETTPAAADALAHPALKGGPTART